MRSILFAMIALLLWSAWPSLSAVAQSCASEREPNDRTAQATAATAGTACLEGTLTDGDIDIFRIPIDELIAQTQIGVGISTSAPTEIELCLVDEAGRTIQCRSGETPALVDLVLPQGDALISVRNRARNDVTYRLERRAAGAFEAGFEREPNDAFEIASPMSDHGVVRGRFVGIEDDFHTFSITGQPQLWRIQAVGDGLTYLAYHDATGAEVKRYQARDGEPIRMDGLYLLPGVHTLRVRGADSEYAVRMIPMGPPVEEALSQDAVDDLLAGSLPNMPAAPADAVDNGDLGPPAAAVTEREFNDDPTRAHKLYFDVPASGLLSSVDDDDLYRFYLGAPAYIRLSVTPPPDSIVNVDLDSFFTNANEGAGRPVVIDFQLPQGDHYLSLDSPQPSPRPYTILVERLDPFLLPVDLEPTNNDQSGAQPMAASHVVTGRIATAADDQDWFRLPEASQDTMLSIEYQGDVTNLNLFGEDGQQQPVGDWDRNAGVYVTMLPAGMGSDLRVRARGSYTLTLAFDPPVDQPATDILPVAMALTANTATVAGFWHAGQQIDVTATLRNDGDKERIVQLDALTSHYAWQPTLNESSVTLAPGATLTVPLAVKILADARTDVHVQLTVAARADSGAQVTAALELMAVCGADPIAPNPAWTTAGPLLGGLNVSWPALGARPDGGGGPLAELFDFVVSPSTGWRGAPGDSVTVELAGDAPVAVAGFLLNPQGRTDPAQQLQDFAVELSSDGTTWTPVISGLLRRAPAEQAFVLDTPAPARFARLHLLTSHDGGNVVGVGAFKVIAAADTPSIAVDGFNLADPALGGHVVYSLPILNQPEHLITEKLDAPRLRFDPVDQIEWTIGFHHDRAAQIAEIQWVDSPGGQSTQRFGSVEVLVSVDSPVGPWQSLGIWNLDPTREDLQTFTLSDPLWARYVRFVAPGNSERATFDYPDVLRILERPGDASYRSILGEYGHYRREAIYELIGAPAPPDRVTGEIDDNDTPQRAQLLSTGQAVRGTVAVGQDEDWYRIDVPDGSYTLRIPIQGFPAVNVLYELLNDEEEPIPYEIEDGIGSQVLTPRVAPGSYYLHITEPVRSVIFSWDTSGSVSPYINQTYQSLVQFAADINPDYEVVNLLPFHDPGPLLLPEWSGDPKEVMAALTNYTREHDSSNAEINLLKATQELGKRVGTRAVVFLTDAESSGYNLSDQLWTALYDVRPRIFTLEMSSRGSDAQDLMEDWADVNRGHHAYLTSIGELDVGFARASCLLRRPVAYQVSMLLQAEALPTPTPTSTSTPTFTPEPTATATLEPTPTHTATAEPTATPTATATPLPTATAEPTIPPLPTPTPSPAGPGTITLITAPGGESALLSGTAVELILDASGSMLQRLEGTRRIDIAKSVLSDLVNTVLPEQAPLALRVFGHIEPDACRTDLEIALQPLDRAAAGALIAGIEAQNLARTPIADSLLLVASDLSAASGQKLVILVTDGEETCDGDPATAIRALQDQGIDVRLNIVGFAIADEVLKAQFEAWAALGGGFYFDASDAAGLNAAIRQAVRVPFRVIDPTGAEVATGFVNDDAIMAPAGVFAIEVLSEPVLRLEGVAVNSSQQTVLKIPPP